MVNFKAYSPSHKIVIDGVVVALFGGEEEACRAEARRQIEAAPQETTRQIWGSYDDSEGNWCWMLTWHFRPGEVVSWS